jgi:hypothetical protein
MVDFIDISLCYETEREELLKDAGGPRCNDPDKEELAALKCLRANVQCKLAEGSATWCRGKLCMQQFIACRVLMIILDRWATTSCRR